VVTPYSTHILRRGLARLDAAGPRRVRRCIVWLARRGPGEFPHRRVLKKAVYTRVHGSCDTYHTPALGIAFARHGSSARRPEKAPHARRAPEAPLQRSNAGGAQAGVRTRAVPNMLGI